MRLPKALTILFCAAALPLILAEPAAAIDTRRSDVKNFIAHMADTYSFKKRALRKLLKGAAVQPAILDAMAKPAEKAKPWYEYRAIFLTEKRINEGSEFWLAHRQALEQASARSGVAPEYLAAILGVETFYGRTTGNYRVLDALVTLSFDYPAREKFFREELEQFLLLARDAHLDPATVKGSYAGAMGAPQFMPWGRRSSCPRITAVTPWTQTRTATSICGAIGPTCARASATTSKNMAGTPANRSSAKPRSHPRKPRPWMAGSSRCRKRWAR
jgi:membrane-bound lytic murein transglycosylase B